MLDTDTVFAVDCDADAILVGKTNATEMELMSQMNFVVAKVKDLSTPYSTTVANDKNGNNNDDNKASKRHAKSTQQRRKGKDGHRGINRNKHDDAKGSVRNGNVESSLSSTLETRLMIASDNDGVPLCSNCVDTCITNPPFGTKNNPGMDIRFLRTACRLAQNTVYSFHKTSTRAFLLNLIQNEWMYPNVQVIAQMKFDIPKIYSFHKEKSVDIEVDLIRIDVSSHTTTTTSVPTNTNNDQNISECKMDSHADGEICVDNQNTNEDYNDHYDGQDEDDDVS